MDAEKLWALVEAATADRASRMPTEQDALQVMFDAYQRLQDLGWSNIMYCPKDGTTFDSISAGSTGIHPCYYRGEWPDGHWWILDGGDVWPAHPILYRDIGDRDGGDE